MNVFSPKGRELWNVWELRVLVVLSLVLQIELIVLGNRRKYSQRSWLKFFLWSAYIMADSVVSLALGIICTKIGKIPVTRRSLDHDIQLIAFRAPFLLLHLGGPDTITAYSLEDNELWLRHMLWLIVQTAVTFNILLLVWTSSILSYLSLLMIIVGFCKYGERIWVLRAASSNIFRKSMLTSPDAGPNYLKFTEEYYLKQVEGYHVKVDEIIEVTVSDVPTSSGRYEFWYRADLNQIRQAHILFQTFKRLFVDLILSFRDRDISRSIINNTSSEHAFRLIEIELGFLYDLLYTKAKVIYTPWGLVRRFISFSLVFVSFFVFIFMAWQHQHTMSEFAVSFLLISSAIFLEIYAALVLISSDQTGAWLSNRKIGYVEEIVTSLHLKMGKRWSRHTPQFSLLSFFIKEKPLIFPKLLKLLGLDQRLEMYLYETREKVTVNLEEFIFKTLKDKLSNPDLQGHLRDLQSQPGINQLKKYGCDKLKWSLEGDLDQSIHIWHIATELCYHSTREENSIKIREIGKQISSYMVYLLLVYPFMLPMGIGEIIFQDTYAEASRFFDEKGPGGLSVKEKLSGNMKIEAAKKLLDVRTDVLPTKVKGDRSKSVLFDACRLARSLRDIKNKEEKWSMINGVWMEMLACAASQCKGINHARQLRRGGELLTHVWLMMAHFGITNHFRISQGHARAKLTLG